jgi:hypothetical protein
MEKQFPNTYRILSELIDDGYHLWNLKKYQLCQILEDYMDDVYKSDDELPGFNSSSYPLSINLKSILEIVYDAAKRDYDRLPSDEEHCLSDKAQRTKDSNSQCYLISNKHD